MTTSYNQTIMVICDSLNTLSLAQHLFVNRFRNARAIDLSQRARNVLTHATVKLVDKPLNYASTSIKDLLQSHKFIINQSGDVNYYIKDMENGMLQMKNHAHIKQGKLFSVVLISEDLFTSSQIKALNMPKIYFYDNRGDTTTVVDKRDYCEEGDDFKIKGMDMNIDSLNTSIEQLYESYNLEV